MVMQFPTIIAGLRRYVDPIGMEDDVATALPHFLVSLYC